MSRLTARTENGNAYLVNVKPDEQEVDSPHKNTLQCILDCFERLAAYEDTGLEPDEIEALKIASMGKSLAQITEFDGVTIDRLRELAGADKDGRCVVLLEPVSNTYKLLKPLEKSELFGMRGTAVLVAHTDGTPMLYGMDRVAAVLDTVSIYGECKMGIVAIYGRGLTLGDSEYGISWVAYDYSAEAEEALKGGTA